MSQAVDDAQYRDMLIELLQMEDPADPVRSYEIQRLEEEVISAGLNLPIVRRVTNPVAPPVDKNDPNATEVEIKLWDLDGA